MSKVLYERDGRIARITLNRPEVLNAIDNDELAKVQKELESAKIKLAKEDPENK